MEIKPKINKWDLIKFKTFCIAKEIVNKMKRQSSELEKIITNKAADKGLISNTTVQKHQLFFMVQLSHPYMTTGKTIALTRQTFVG